MTQTHLNEELEIALANWKNSAQQQLNELSEAAKKIEETKQAHLQAKATYRALWNQAQRNGLIDQIGRQKLKEAGIPAPTTAKKKK